VIDTAILRQVYSIGGKMLPGVGELKDRPNHKRRCELNIRARSSMSLVTAKVR
jgi:hypothetical protein